MASQTTMPETKVDLSDQPHSQWQSSPQASIDLQQQLMLSSVSKPGVKRKTSPVWHVFRKCEPDKYGRNVECTATVTLSSPSQPEGTVQCGKRYKVTEQTATTRASGTSGLREHIRQKHPAIYAQMISPTIPSFGPKHTRAHTSKGMDPKCEASNAIFLVVLILVSRGVHRARRCVLPLVSLIKLRFF